MRRSLFFRAGAATVLLGAVLLGASRAGAAPRTFDGGRLLAGHTYYATTAPICRHTGAHHAVCDAMRRELVAKSTTGAEAFRIPVGATTQTIGPAGGLTPADLAAAYDLKPTGGAGQTVALIDAYNDPDIASDLASFDSQYGLSCNSCLTVYNQSGATSPLPADDTVGWSEEETLDVEAVHAVCEGCTIDVVEATTQSLANLAAADETAATVLHANEISNSWGYPESDSTSAVEADFNQPGVVVTASGGDSGYYDWDNLRGQDKPDVPSAYPTVVSVGGTSLELDSSGTRQSETVWNDDGVQAYDQVIAGQPLGATGGGCSTLFPAEKWQSSLSDWSATGCGSLRLANDVAADADPYTGLDIYDSFSCGSACTTGWVTIGGTSLASPIIAAIYGLAGGAHGVAYPALTLYGHLGTSSLYDVTVGGNGYCDGEGAPQCGDPNTLGDGVLDCDFPATGSTPSAGDLACDATTGFDGPSGVGAPNGLGAFTPTGPGGKVSGPTTATKGKAATWKVAAKDPFPGGKVTSYKWTWGDGTSTTTTSASASHTYAKAATVTITVTMTDSYGQTGKVTDKVAVS